MTIEVWQVSLDYATYGLVTEDGRVIETPPIARWAIYKPIEYVKLWVRQQGGRVEKVEAAQ